MVVFNCYGFCSEMDHKANQGKQIADFKMIHIIQRNRCIIHILKVMKKILVFLFISLMTLTAAQAQGHKYQRGYYRKSTGTYVTGHYKTRSDYTNHNNFSTRGNRNSYTGTSGYRARDYSSGAYNYGRGKTIHTGSRGGQYYYNSRGNKTYVPKRY